MKEFKDGDEAALRLKQTLNGLASLKANVEGLEGGEPLTPRQEQIAAYLKRNLWRIAEDADRLVCLLAAVAGEVSWLDGEFVKQMRQWKEAGGGK